jgi:hypothetical protein
LINSTGESFCRAALQTEGWPIDRYRDVGNQYRYRL